MPLIVRLITQLSHVHDSHTDNNAYASFAFLYGCLPSAPTVFVYAYYADVAVKQVNTILNLFITKNNLDVTCGCIGHNIISTVAIHDRPYDKYGTFIKCTNSFRCSHITIQYCCYKFYFRGISS